MLCNCYWIVLYTVHITTFCLGGGGIFFRTRCICRSSLFADIFGHLIFSHVNLLPLISTDDKHLLLLITDISNHEQMSVAARYEDIINSSSLYL